MKKLKSYDKFDLKEAMTRPSDFSAIDTLIEKILMKKNLIFMLNETFNHVSEEIKSVMPEDINKFVKTLSKEEKQIWTTVESLNDLMVDGFPSIKDSFEEILDDIKILEKHMAKKIR
jgi:lipoate-protein ligase A